MKKILLFILCSMSFLLFACDGGREKSVVEKTETKEVENDAGWTGEIIVDEKTYHWPLTCKDISDMGFTMEIQSESYKGKAENYWLRPEEKMWVNVCKNKGGEKKYIFSVRGDNYSKGYTLLKSVNFSSLHSDYLPDGKDIKLSNGLGVGASFDEIKEAWGTPIKEEDDSISYNYIVDEKQVLITFAFNEMKKVKNFYIDDYRETPPQESVKLPPLDTEKKSTAKINKMSNDWKDATFEINGNAYQFPLGVKDVSEIGFSIGDADYLLNAKELRDDSSIPGYKTEDEKIAFFNFRNPSEKPRLLADCETNSIFFVKESVGKKSDLKMSGGIHIGSDKEELKKCFGKPESTFQSWSGVFSYELDSDEGYKYTTSISGKKIEYNFYLNKGKIVGINLQFA